MKWIYDLSADELGASLPSHRFKAYNTAQIMAWIYRRGQPRIEEWTDISKENRQFLADFLDTGLRLPEKQQEDGDGTTKYLFRLTDGHAVESVRIPEKEHTTFCVSSQVGCSLRCAFCETGKMGFHRNLSSGEILNQILVLQQSPRPVEGKLNLVFMGMGEPLMNYPNLRKALEIVIPSAGMGISPRAVTVSTAGILSGIQSLERDFPKVKLSLSLNAASQEERQRLMPVAARQPLSGLMRYLSNTPRKHRITFEYVLLKGVNDSTGQARRLARLVRKIPCKINLIPYNMNSTGFLQPDHPAIDAFARVLRNEDLTVTVRWSRGGEIQSACGQLAVDQDNPK